MKKIHRWLGARIKWAKNTSAKFQNETCKLPGKLTDLLLVRVFMRSHVHGIHETQNTNAAQAIYTLNAHHGFR